MMRHVLPRMGLLTLVFLAGCQAATENRVSVDYYSIQGNSTAALDREIRRKGPRLDGGLHAVAVARIKMLPDVEFEPSQGRCGVSDARVRVDAKVTLPKWAGRARAKGELAQAWDNMDAYTRLHEAVHVRIAFAYARRLEAELKAMATEADCASMRSAASRLVQERLADHHAAQREFDVSEQKRIRELVAQERPTRLGG